jgi:Zn-dependent protease
MTTDRRTLVVLVAVGIAVLWVSHLSRGTWLLLAVLIPAIILHEVSHGVVALAFGDDTAKKAGRLTLNPIAHVDPVGSIALPLLLAVAGAPLFGWAKPVPVNPRQLRNPRQQSLLVSLAGPATNIVLAIGAAVVLRGARDPNRLTLPVELVFWFGYINVVLATFNLIPIPPLDGSAIIERFLPATWWPGWLRLRQYSFAILFLLVFLLPGNYLERLFNFSLNLWGHLWGVRFT